MFYMEPTYPVGSQVIVKPLSKEEAKHVQVNEPITFLPFPDDATTVTHRVYSRSMRPDGQIEFQTKGDNLDHPDDWIITPKMIRGRVIYMVPYAGYVVNWLGDERQNLLVGGFVILALFYAVYQFWASAKERKHNREILKNGTAGATQHILDQLKQNDPAIYHSIHQLSQHIAAQDQSISLSTQTSYRQAEQEALPPAPETELPAPETELPKPAFTSKYDLLKPEDIEQIRQEIAAEFNQKTQTDQKHTTPANQTPNQEFLSPQTYQLELNTQIEKLLQQVEKDKTESQPVKEEVHGFFNRRKQAKEHTRQLELLREDLRIEALQAQKNENERLTEQARQRRVQWEQTQQADLTATEPAQIGQPTPKHPAKKATQTHKNHNTKTPLGYAPPTEEKAAAQNKTKTNTNPTSPDTPEITPPTPPLGYATYTPPPYPPYPTYPTYNQGPVACPPPYPIPAPIYPAYLSQMYPYPPAPYYPYPYPLPPTSSNVTVNIPPTTVNVDTEPKTNTTHTEHSSTFPPPTTHPGLKIVGDTNKTD